MLIIIWHIFSSSFEIFGHWKWTIKMINKTVVIDHTWNVYFFFSCASFIDGAFIYKDFHLIVMVNVSAVF